MKFILPLALLALGASAQSTTEAAAAASTSCAADYIVTQCLETENKKFDACGSTDYDCQCAAQQAIATCYNNCPNDPRASQAEGQVQIYCQNASLYGTAATKATKTAASGSAASTAAAATTTAASASGTASGSAAATASGSSTASASSPDKTNAAADMIRNTGSVLLAVAGVVAAVL